jgi:hypothetical protein
LFFFIGFGIDPLARIEARPIFNPCITHAPITQPLHHPRITQTSSLFVDVIRLNDALEVGGKCLERKRKRKGKGKRGARKRWKMREIEIK